MAHRKAFRASGPPYRPGPANQEVANRRRTVLPRAPAIAVSATAANRRRRFSEPLFRPETNVSFVLSSDSYRPLQGSSRITRYTDTIPVTAPFRGCGRSTEILGDQYVSTGSGCDAHLSGVIRDEGKSCMT